MDKEKTIVFMEFDTLGVASIVKGALESNNIPCFLSNVNSPYPGTILSNSLFGIRLHIFEEDLEKAEELYALVSSATEDGSDDEIEELNSKES